METSFIRIPFGFDGKFSIFRPNIYLQNDKRIQTTYCTIRNNNKKDSFSWNQYDLLPSFNEHYANNGYFNRFYNNFIRVPQRGSQTKSRINKNLQTKPCRVKGIT